MAAGDSFTSRGGSRPDPSPNGIPTAVHVLVLNAGSSSLKYGFFRVLSRTTNRLVASGVVECIGQALGTAKYKTEYTDISTEAEFKTHSDALHHVIRLLTDGRTGVVTDPSDIQCVGHRVVHGGSRFKTAAVIDDDVLAAIEEACSLAPLHGPHNLLGIQVAKTMFPVPQVAVFDTAFHMTMPPEAYTYAIPKALAEKHHVRRYGFHGTSYSYACRRAAGMVGRPLRELNMIACHLGAGASMACIRRGECVDTTMGVTPLEGLVMATRSGDIDAGALLHIAKEEGLELSQFSDLLNKQSGLKGMCGMSDMRSITLAADQGDATAKLARAVFVHRIRKYLGSYIVQLGGKVDCLIFTAGIGENDPSIRSDVCDGLNALGINLDEDKNRLAAATAASNGCAFLDSTFSRTRIVMVRADEEGEIANQAVAAAGLMESEVASTGMHVRQGAARGGIGYVYLAPLADGCGVTTSAIGLVGVLLGAGKLDPEWIVPFLPFEDDSSPYEQNEAGDPVLTVMQNVMHCEKVPREELVGVPLSKAYEYMNEGNDTELLDMVIERFEALRNRGMDFILAMGHPAVGMAWHKKIAAALGVPMIVVGSLPDDTRPSQVKDSVLKMLNPIDDSVKVKGVIVNRLPTDTDRVALHASLQKRNFPPLGLIPRSRRMAEVSMAEVVAALGAKVRFGREALERVPMSSLLVATLHMEQLLNKIREKGTGVMVIVHCGRGDVILGILAAIQARGFPAVSGILVTGGSELDPAVESVLQSTENIPLPIMSVQTDTFLTASEIVNMRRKLAASGVAKVEQAISLFERFTDKKLIYSLVDVADHRAEMPITPRLFQFQIKARARARRQRIVLPEGNDPRVVTAACELLSRGLCKVILLGDVDDVSKLAQRLQINIQDATVIDNQTYEGLEEMAADLAERRKSKGVTIEAARRELKNNPNMFATMMLARGMADGIVSGACHTTADTMRPALQVIKCAPGVKLVSSVFFMLLEDGVKVFGDCAIMESPDSAELATIAQASALTATAFGINPRIAMLSYATGDSNTGPMIAKVREATEIVKRDCPMFADKIDGPIQFDAAVDPEVAAVKYKGDPGPVAGRANVCIFPDLNAGNNAYKAVQQATGCVAIGPVMQGLRMPVNDLSRGCTVEDIIQTAIVTCVQAIAGSKPAEEHTASVAATHDHMGHLKHLRAVGSVSSMSEG